MNYQVIVLNFLNSIKTTQNYDVFSILDINNTDPNDIYDFVDILKTFYDNKTDRGDLHMIKEFYQNNFYNFYSKLNKIKYILILYIGNKNYKKDTILQYINNYKIFLKNSHEDQDIILLENRLNKLKFEIENDIEKLTNEVNLSSDDDDSDDNSNAIIIKKKINTKNIII